MTASTSNDTNLIVKNSAIEDADHCQEYFKTDGVSHLNQGNVTTADKPNDLNADCSAYNASGGDSHKQSAKNESFANCFIACMMMQ